MIRKAVRAATVLFAALAVPTTVLAAPPPASAAPTNDRLLESYGSYYVGAPDLSLYQPVMETSSGRYLHLIDSMPDPQVDLKIVFNADNSTKCVAGANNGTDVVIHPCDGNYVVWRLSSDAGGYFFQNLHFGTYLAGANNGTQFQLKPKPSPGWYERFLICSLTPVC